MNIFYSNIFRNPDFLSELGFIVIDMDSEAGLIRVQPYLYYLDEPFGDSFWISEKDKMFDEKWLVYND